MNSSFSTLLRIFAKPFFRENAGTFIFFYTVMILAVGHLDGQGVLHYHYMLIIGMLRNPDTFLLVCLGWLLYQLKCLTFVERNLEKRGYQFLYIINCLPGVHRFGMTFFLMTVLFAPIGWYGLLILGVALYHHYYMSATVLIFYMILLCFVSAARVVLKMNFPGLISYRRSKLSGLFTTYPAILIRFVFEEQKVLWTTIKLFTCGMLYGFALVNTAAAYDPRFPFLFFSFGILANGVIIHRIRSFEENFMVFHRTDAVSRFRRWLQYVLVYAILLLPEFITILCLVPVHLHIADAIGYAFSGLTLVMLLNSICFLEDFTMVQYLKAILVVMCVQYFFVLFNSLTWLYVIYFTVASVIFYTSFYSFEKRPKSGNF